MSGELCMHFLNQELVIPRSGTSIAQGYYTAKPADSTVCLCTLTQRVQKLYAKQGIIYFVINCNPIK